jgi:hypothetical protein
LIPPKEKKNTTRRDPGGHRDAEIYINGFVLMAFSKKGLCGLCVLRG